MEKRAETGGKRELFRAVEMLITCGKENACPQGYG
jgi:hypothetical protein